MTNSVASTTTNFVQNVGIPGTIILLIVVVILATAAISWLIWWFRQNGGQSVDTHGLKFEDDDTSDLSKDASPAEHPDYVRFSACSYDFFRDQKQLFRSYFIKNGYTTFNETQWNAYCADKVNQSIEALKQYFSINLRAKVLPFSTFISMPLFTYEIGDQRYERRTMIDFTEDVLVLMFNEVRKAAISTKNEIISNEEDLKVYKADSISAIRTGLYNSGIQMKEKYTSIPNYSKLTPEEKLAFENEIDRHLDSFKNFTIDELLYQYSNRIVYIGDLRNRKMLRVQMEKLEEKVLYINNTLGNVYITALADILSKTKKKKENI